MTVWSAPPKNPPGARRARRVGGSVAAAAFVVAATVVAVVTVVIPATDDRRTATDALRDAQQFVAKARTIEFHNSMAAATGNRRRSSHVSIDGAAVFPNKSRTLEHYPGTVGQSISIGNIVYVRFAKTEARLKTKTWIPLDTRPGGGDFAQLDQGSGSLLFMQNLPRALAQARHPRIVGRAGSVTTIRVELQERGGIATLPGGQLRQAADVTVNADGTIPKLVQRVSVGDSQVTNTVRFRWNGPVTIKAPARRNIDATPSIDEKALEGFSDTPLYQPAAIPQGWVFESAEVLAAKDTTEKCPEVYTVYGDPRQGSGSLEVYQFPLDCSLGRPDSARDLIAGPNRGWVTARRGDLMGELMVGNTVVQFVTDLSADQLAEILAELERFDATRPPPASLAGRESA